MAHPALPNTVSPHLAGLLIGRSRAAIYGMIAAGLLPAAGRVHARIAIRDLEQLAGREISLDDWADAIDRFGQRQASQRAYNANRETNRGLRA